MRLVHAKAGVERHLAPLHGLPEATRQDYLAAFDYLRPEFDIVLKDITQPDLYAVRDKCANDKWPRFADQMVAELFAFAP